MSSHARLSPSNHRWVHCPGSVREEAAYPDVSGKAAIDGTGTHLLLEMCITNKCGPEDYANMRIGLEHEDCQEGWLVDKARMRRVKIALNYIKRRVSELKRDHPNCTINVQPETKADPGRLYDRKDWNGTCDIRITAHDDKWRLLLLEIIDYKDGQMQVDAEDNSQLQSYALGSLAGAVDDDGHLRLKHWDFNIRMTIVQPKHRLPIRYEDTKVTKLLKKGEELALAAERTDDENAPLIPDEMQGNGWCRWCKHKDNCSALQEKRLAIVKKFPNRGMPLFDMLERSQGRVSDLKTQELSEILDAKPVMDAIFEAAEKEAEARLNGGQEIPGYRMFPGRTTRVYAKTNEDIIQWLKKRRFKEADFCETKLLSPAQMMKGDLLTDELKEKFSREFITERYGTLKLKKCKRKPEEIMFGDLPDVMPGTVKELNFF